VVGEGHGSNKHAAEHFAAKNALKSLGIE